jgi:hypothetical protein
VEDGGLADVRRSDKNHFALDRHRSDGRSGRKWWPKEHASRNM